MLRAGPADAPTTLLLAHGAGAPMDSPWMDRLAAALGRAGIGTHRFEFGYMAARREGRRRPPPRAEALVEEYRAAVAAAAGSGRLLIGGKSLGGRVASLLADALFAERRVAGLVCFGYPFHPPGRPDKLRTAHLETLSCPALICQGTRDPFGPREEVEGYRLSPALSFHWVNDGDHDLKPRRAVGTAEAATDAAAEAVSAWASRL